LKWGDGRAGGRREYAGEDAVPQTEHGARPTVREGCKNRRRRSVRETLGDSYMPIRSARTARHTPPRGCGP
jgi:hypothetical protein